MPRVRQKQNNLPPTPRKLWGIYTTEEEKGKNDWYMWPLNDSPESYAEWKKPVPQGYILNDSIYWTFLKWQNYENREEIAAC